MAAKLTKEDLKALEALMSGVVEDTLVSHGLIDSEGKRVVETQEPTVKGEATTTILKPGTEQDALRSMCITRRGNDSKPKFVDKIVEDNDPTTAREVLTEYMNNGTRAAKARLADLTGEKYGSFTKGNASKELAKESPDPDRVKGEAAHKGAYSDGTFHLPHGGNNRNYVEYILAHVIPEDTKKGTTTKRNRRTAVKQ